MRKVCHIHFCAAISCAAVLSIVYAVFGLYPFGEKTLAWCDMSQQVVPLLMELKDVLAGRSSWLLNLQNAGGMSFWGVFFFFLSSPFHLAVMLVDKADVFRLVNVLVLMKLSLAAATSSVFFKREAPGLPMITHIALSLSYGLCGYGLMYYQNLVWLDMLYLFPLTMLGFVRLTEDGKAGLLTVCLTLSVVFNYYLSYMLLLGMIIFGAVFIFACAEKERRGEISGKLGLSAVTALMLTAAVWLPSLLQCLASARTDMGAVQSIQSGGFLADMRTTSPVLLCSIGAALVPFLGHFFPKTPKTRAITVCWAMTALPMAVEPINKMWHLGSYQAFPARYGYMPVFFGLWCLALGLNSPPRTSRTRPVRTVFVLALPVILGAYILCAHFDEISSYTSTLWVSTKGSLCFAFFWMACMAAALCACSMYAGEHSRRIASWALLGVVMVGAAVQLPAFMGSAANMPSRSLAVLAAEPIKDGGLYRVKQERKFCHVNLFGGMGYPTLNHYTSLTDARYLGAMKKLGYSSYWMETSGCCGTTVSDILLSNKYVLDSGLSWMSTGSGDLGYLVPEGVLPRTIELGDRIQLQNELCESLSGRGLFTRYEPLEGEPAEQDGSIMLKEGRFRYEIIVDERETLYFDAFDCISTRLKEAINDGFSVTVNGSEIAESYPTQRCNGILELGSFEDEIVTVEITVRKPMKLCSFGVWGLRDAGILADHLPNAQLRFENGRISGSAEASKGQALFLSVPWYDGVEVRVDGRKVPVKQVLDCFMEIPLPDGYSRIEVSYIPAGLRLGIAVSTAALFVLGLYCLFREKSPVIGLRGIICWFAPLLLMLSFIAAALIVYVAPPVIWAIKYI